MGWGEVGRQDGVGAPRLHPAPANLHTPVSAPERTSFFWEPCTLISKLSYANIEIYCISGLLRCWTSLQQAFALAPSFPYLLLFRSVTIGVQRERGDDGPSLPSPFSDILLRNSQKEYIFLNISPPPFEFRNINIIQVCHCSSLICRCLKML